MNMNVSHKGSPVAQLKVTLKTTHLKEKLYFHTILNAKIK